MSTSSEASPPIDDAAVEEGHADYGRIHFRIPKETLQPESEQELAETLQAKAAKGEAVAIRNTGHSTNGQTLTDATQIDISRLAGARFDEANRIVYAGPAASWDSVIRTAQFPRYAPPIFPNNPGQQIRVGGTASVGGVGFYCSKYGGFWNHVSSLRLVTMGGEIIDCSPDTNADLFRYSLGGYGRIGVITEVGVDVLPSKPKILALVLVYWNDETFHRDLKKALDDPELDGVAAQQDLSGWEARVLRVLGVDLKLIVVMREVDDGVDAEAVADEIRDRYDEELTLFVEAGADVTGLGLSRKPELFDKEYVVYFTPSEQSWWSGLWSKILALFGKESSSTVDVEKLCHPWTDCLVAPERYEEFLPGAVEIIHRHGMAEHLEKESFINGLVDIDSFVTFGIKRRWERPEDRLPLSLDLPDVEKFTLGVAVMPNVTRDQLDAGIAMSRELTDHVYACGGRRYLYGTHDLTREQVETHYGRSTLDRWQALKDEHDPHHLLNIGVIEHLDE